MTSLLLIFFLIIMVYLFLNRSRGLRETALQSYLIMFGITVLVTELLSLIDGITERGLIAAWSILIGLMIGYFIIRKYFDKKALGLNLKTRLSFPKTSRIDKLIIVGIVIILAVTILIAACAPPNNFDSMTYHMARIAHWIQQGNINFYPTAIERQNHSMPLAEYMILHLQILSKSDQFANYVQWTAFVISIVAVSDIARLMGVSQTGQLFSGLFTATLPLAILQSSSTQNDLLTGAFCLIFVYFLILFIQNPKWEQMIFAGLAMGLALFTKGTAYIYCAALGISIGGLSLFTVDKRHRNQLLKGFAILIVLALILNMGIYSRNIMEYSHPLSTENGRITNDEVSIGILYANLIRNGAAHLAVPIPHLNELFTNIITNHLGPKVSNPESTFPGATFQVQFLINEDEAGNLLHFILLTVIIVLTVGYQRLKDEHSWKYITGIIISIVLFSLLIKWQPWGVRLQLPIFMFGSPLVGYGIEKLKLSKIATLICVIGLLTYSLPYLTLNSTRPLVPILPKGSPLRSNRVRRFFSNKPTLYNEYAEIIAPYYKDQSVLYADRESQYFFSNYSIYQDYQAVMDVVNGFSVDTVGLLFDNNDWEYPIWVMADSHAYVGTPTFKHIIFRNTSGERICNGANLPRYVISTQMLEDGLICGIKYNEMVTTSSLSLLER